MNLEEMKSELITDLEEELNNEDNFNRVLLEKKVTSAIKEVRSARRYPKTYDVEQIADDMERFYSHIRSIALYDYNQSGVEGQTSSNENGISRVYVDRNSLFRGIVPISRVY